MSLQFASHVSMRIAPLARRETASRTQLFLMVFSGCVDYLKLGRYFVRTGRSRKRLLRQFVERI
jgi:hypothetical protein